MHPSRRAQIAHLKADKTPTKVLNKYANFVDALLPKLAVKFSKHTKINDHTIVLVDDWQFPYSFIYSLGLMKLETLKAYIKNNLANSFIRLFKCPAGVSIFFNKKLDGSLRLCVDYRGLSNLIINNWYLLLLIRESLD